LPKIEGKMLGKDFSMFDFHQGSDNTEPTTNVDPNNNDSQIGNLVENANTNTTNTTLSSIINLNTVIPDCHTASEVSREITYLCDNTCDDYYY